MFPYTVKYTESESDIKNNGSLYKIHQKCQNTFDIGKFWENQESILFKIFDFKMISVLWRFLLLAFGGPKILVYIYIYLHIYYRWNVMSITNMLVDHEHACRIWPFVCLRATRAMQAIEHVYRGVPFANSGGGSLARCWSLPKKNLVG